MLGGIQLRNVNCVHISFTTYIMYKCKYGKILVYRGKCILNCKNSRFFKLVFCCASHCAYKTKANVKYLNFLFYSPITYPYYIPLHMLPSFIYDIKSHLHLSN